MIIRHHSELSETDSVFLEVKNKSWSQNFLVGHEVKEMLEDLWNADDIYDGGLYNREKLSSFIASE